MSESQHEESPQEESPQEEVERAVEEKAPDLSEMDDRTSRLERQIEEVRKDWEDLEQDRSVPGAQTPLDAEETTRQDMGESPPAGDDEDAS